MNMPDPQLMTNAWMAQLNESHHWKSWFPALPETVANPMAGILDEIGAVIQPEALERLKNYHVAHLGTLWQDFLAGKTPALSDRRFAAPAWRESPVSAFNAASYLLNAQFLTALADAVEASPHQKQKIQFAVLQMVDAMSPANFMATNPDAQKKMIEPKGESLTKGWANMLADMQ